ncbi:hypothetical protein THOG11_220042 [Vibrio harveyi]|nr:hypothetical protein TH15OA1_280019 [Vibrio harveyi]CAH1560534.1 hypothetical protein THOD03_250043 [Vibrio harveyi]CAH1566302.1 hypothetical protein THOG11_220042 [Vibrio harveyi]
MCQPAYGYENRTSIIDKIYKYYLNISKLKKPAFCWLFLCDFSDGRQNNDEISH